MTATARVRVWDLPTRLCHWLLTLAVVAAVATAQVGGGWMDWHGRIGLLILGLLAFRLAWGLMGSTYARFLHFLPTPAALCAYLRGEWRGAGHNPLGALSVFAMLGLLLAQAGLGLFANDDIAFRGHLFPLAGKELSDRLTGWHADLFYLLLLPVLLLHMASIVYYARVKRRDLLRPMLHGAAEVPAGTPPARGGGPVVLAAAVAFAGSVVWLAGSGWLVERFAPPPPPPAAAPDW